ncbi:MAG: Gx transporter family protein [Clostridiales bacterium]|nr:Gx transporter family protein [Clostridiales bacterium]
MLSPGRTRQLTLIAVLLALSLVLGYFERLLNLDFIIPGVKLGLANIVIVYGLYLLDFPQALLLTLLKCLAGVLLVGSFLAFWYSLAGALLSFLVMWVIKYLFKEKISPIGVSVCGGVCHNLGQMGVALFLVRHLALANYLPILITAGAITGFLIGITVRVLLRLRLR